MFGRKAFSASAEQNEKKRVLTPVRIVKLVLSVVLLGFAVTFAVFAISGTLKTSDKYYLIDDSAKFTVASNLDTVEEAFEESKTADVEYISPDYYGCVVTVNYTDEEWEQTDRAKIRSITCFIYSNNPADSEDGEDSVYIGFDHEADSAELLKAHRGLNADEHSSGYGAAMALFFVAVAAALLFFWHEFFTTYEQIWFISVIALAAVFSVVFPEEECNGINGLIIMLLYLLDTFLNILCELLISKQSKWNFIVSVFVELTEIAICIVLSYRFATLATTLFFWLPCDIISFVNWHRHPDRQKEELTIVRTLRGWQEVLIVAGIVVWTVVVGWFLSGLDITTDLFDGNKTLATVVCYLDACASAVGVCNGLFILFRLREQWIAWYISAALESVINILSGQYVLLVLKLGYFTNTTYGYIKWTKYIKNAEDETTRKKINPNAHAKVPEKELKKR